jgi:hypothetical protein
VDTELLDLLKYCKSIPISTDEELNLKKIKIGPKFYQKTILLDLDETLVSCESQFVPKELYKESLGLKKDNDASLDFESLSLKSNDEKLRASFTVAVDYNEGHILIVNCVLRPNVLEALECLSTSFEIGVFTAGE